MQFNLFERTVSIKYTILVRGGTSEESLKVAEAHHVGREDDDTGDAEVIERNVLQDSTSYLTGFCTFTPTISFSHHFEETKDILIKPFYSYSLDRVNIMMLIPEVMEEVHSDWKHGWHPGVSAESIHRKHGGEHN